MTSIVTFQSKYGPVHVEVDDSVAREAQGKPEDTGNGWVAKGATPMTVKGAGGLQVELNERFENAMGSLKGYAGTILDLVGGLDMTPKEVSVEVGLKLAGSAGFIIAKAEGEAEMKISLTWEPGAQPKDEPPTA